MKGAFEKLVVTEEKHEIANLPNLITMLRLSIIPFLFILLLEPDRIWSLVIAALFIIAALTDLLDGYIARKYSMVTKVGKILDPIADKLVVSTAMILMIPIGRIPAWIVALIVMRDIAVDGVRHLATAGGLIMSASRLGKQKTLSQVIATAALLIHYPLFGIDAHRFGIVVLYVALIMTIWSAADYFFKFYVWAFSGSRKI